ncbi:hypothetical protein ABIB40_001140 [Pedobacter sp. UYP30]
MVYPIFEYAHSPSYVFLYLGGLDLGIDIIPNLVVPHKSDHGQQDQFFRPVQGGHMGFLYIKAARFHCFEKCFDLPALSVIIQCLLGLVKRDKYKKLHLSVYNGLNAKKIAELIVHPNDQFIMRKFVNLFSNRIIISLL